MRPIGRILVPVDFSSGSRAAMEHGAMLARCCGATIDALYVWQPPQSVTAGALIQLPGLTPQPIEQFAESAARREMEVFLALESPAGIEVAHLLERGDPANVIVRVARERRHDLVVMGTHGRTGLSHAVMGSVAEKVARLAPCPVMLVKGAEERMEGAVPRAAEP